MLEEEQKKELKSLVDEKLNEAEQIWENLGSEMIVFSARNENLKKFASVLAEEYKTNIPGYFKITKPERDDFIAIVIDMRDSSLHLKTSVTNPKEVTQLKRVFFETAAMLPCLTKVIEYENGRVTEYLGDGLLAIIKASKCEIKESVYAASRASNNCLIALQEIINPTLESRYSLKPLSIGIGMAYSPAIVSVVGLEGHLTLGKVYGECVYNATKLADGRNKIAIGESLKYVWPSGEKPTVKFGFAKEHRSKVKGYDLERI